MADTNYLKNEVENWVRNWLQGQFPGHIFSKQYITLTSGGRHEFDAVSEDGNIIAGIKSSSHKTSGGNLPSGKFAVLYQELYFLSLVNAPTKLLILTNQELFIDFVKRSEAKVAEGIQIRYCQLPADIIKQVNLVKKKASQEQGSKST
jgi:hypothetical protein